MDFFKKEKNKNKTRILLFLETLAAITFSEEIELPWQISEYTAHRESSIFLLGLALKLQVQEQIEEDCEKWQIKLWWWWGGGDPERLWPTYAVKGRGGEPGDSWLIALIAFWSASALIGTFYAAKWQLCLSYALCIVRLCLLHPPSIICLFALSGLFYSVQEMPAAPQMMCV